MCHKRVIIWASYFFVLLYKYLCILVFVAAAACPGIFSYINGLGCVAYIENRETWVDARDYCKDHKGDLYYADNFDALKQFVEQRNNLTDSTNNKKSILTLSVKQYNKTNE